MFEYVQHESVGLLDDEETFVSASYSVLACDGKHFNGDAELRNVFGQQALSATEAAESSAHRQRQRMHIRKTLLVKPKPDWPLVGMGKTGRILCLILELISASLS